MLRIDNFYQKVRIFGTPNFKPKLADKVLGNGIFIPSSDTERFRRELFIVPLEGRDFLVQVNYIEKKGESREIQKIPLGVAEDLSLTNYFLFVKARGDTEVVEGDSPKIEQAYEKIDNYQKSANMSLKEKLKNLIS